MDNKTKPQQVEKSEEVSASAEKTPEVKAADTPLVKELITFEDDGAADDAYSKTPAHDESKQMDYLPGTRVKDMLALPEKVWDDDRGVGRRPFRHDVYHYCWVEGSDVTTFKMNGYRLANYNGGNQAGLEEPGLSGTYLYECDNAGHIRLGDAYLMFCPIRLFNALVAEDRANSDRLSRIHETNYHNMGYRYGIRTFSEVDGKTQSN